MSDIDDERIKKYLGSVEERINFAKENGCKLLDCKVIDENIKLRQENIKLKKIAEKLADVLKNLHIGDYICDFIPNEHCNKYTNKECIKCVIDWAKSEVERNETK